MLKLDYHLRLDPSVAKSTNLATLFGQDDLDRIGGWVWDGYSRDDHSLMDWRRRNQAGMDLALQLQKQKDFPWPGAANVAFPLVTIAAMQFHSRAYPALVSGTDIVKCRVPGPDDTGEATARAKLVGKYMSYQVLEEDQAWEEQHDRLLLQIPIIGCAFVKTRYDAVKGHNVSELVPAMSLVMDYYAKSVDACQRKTHIIPFFRNQIHERCMSGVWLDITKESWYCEPTAPYVPPGTQEADARKGQHPGTPDEATPLVFLEQHVWVDFDQDGYQEPYTITVEAQSKKVVRIVARWDRPEDVERNSAGKVIRITPTESFTKYGLIPSPDGGVYDMGFGVLLGPLNESVNTLVNQIIDAGTMANAAGGFLSRGVKIRGGAYTFTPFGWQRVDSTGDDLRKGIVPLPVREPSAVLFNLLSFLVNYTQRVGGASDMIQGENPGQNTPAQTSQAMIEQGMKIYSALFKRCWRSMKDEFSKLYILNAKFTPVTKRFGQSGQIAREDFKGDPSQICPAADPAITSTTMRMQLAVSVAERSKLVAGYDPEAVERNLLSAMQVDGVEVLYPGLEKFPPQGDPKWKIEEGKLQFKAAELQVAQQQFMMTLQEEQRVNNATIIKLQGDAMLAAAKADNEGKGQELAQLDAMIGLAKTRNEAIQTQLQAMISHMEAETNRKEAETNRILAEKPVVSNASK